ncbi:uncharacterized protein KGF55_002568 [Candida pseudojiufengensis]|uniref:uncharacterized protein n=1 Tax=Candida pseudojiufengensis TaxID=497109 RepID=UPI0022254C8F|nr:uncharacterized protein KGF55_002568 [Candida pseudojiufengensis]KAI5963688.1 hypothetical protein KGF55_002568 [Candida pseudojiufengensis]
MLSTTATNSKVVSSSTFNFVTRFIWNNTTRSTTKKDQPPENEVLADALNLLTKSPSRNDKRIKNFSSYQNYKPSLYNSLTKGSVAEQFNETNYDFKSTKHQHINESFINNLIFGLKSSTLNSSQNLSHSKLLELGSKELSLYIKNVKDESYLFEIIQLFLNHNKLNLKVMADILLNKNLINMKKLPINIESNNVIKGLSSEDMIKLQIILLKKHHDLKHPINVIRNLKQNFDTIYLPLIKENELPAFYERIIWRFVFEYLKQYNEEQYIEKLNNLKTSLIIWESCSYNHVQNISAIIFKHHNEQLSILQKFVLKIGQSINSNSQVLELKKISMKHKIHNLNSEPKLDENNRKLSYALINDLEKYLITHSKENPQFKTILEELALYRVKYIKNAFANQSQEFDSLNKILEFNT